MKKKSYAIKKSKKWDICKNYLISHSNVTFEITSNKNYIK